MSNKSHAIFQNPRILIAAPHSGSGKTTVTLALMAALKNRGLNVQGFKCGPDYIDPGYHRAITSRVSHNLDSWFVQPAIVRQIFFNNASGADISLIEGVMGLFDGKNPANNEGSSAHIAEIIGAPVILVLDARSMARSAAAIVRGFQIFSKKIKIAGVILNKCGSKNHIDILQGAIEKECGIPVLGGFLRNDQLQIPERQLGLLPAIERGELDSLFVNLAKLAEESLDIDQLLEFARKSKRITPGTKQIVKSVSAQKSGKNITVAVALDEAFNFYYPENLELMENAGMRLVYFSPLNNEPLPENTDGLYLGGGFPEEFARTLSRNKRTMESIQNAVENGLPSVAECGGFMYLTTALTDSHKKRYRMTGILPGEVIMQNHLAALGYREIQGLKGNFLLDDGIVIRGHEFHYSVYENQQTTLDKNVPPAYLVTGRNIEKSSGMIYKNLIAGYMHFYFLSNPLVVYRWAEKCLEYKSGQIKKV